MQIIITQCKIRGHGSWKEKRTRDWRIGGGCRGCNSGKQLKEGNRVPSKWDRSECRFCTNRWLGGLWLSPSSASELRSLRTWVEFRRRSRGTSRRRIGSVMRRGRCRGKRWSFLCVIATTRRRWERRCHRRKDSSSASFGLVFGLGVCRLEPKWSDRVSNFVSAGGQNIHMKFDLKMQVFLQIHSKINYVCFNKI